MNIKSLFFVFTMLFLLIVDDLSAQDVSAGNHILFQVGAKCTQRQMGSFAYNYMLTNESTSEQRIWVFAIFTKIYRDSISSVASPGWDYGIPKNEIFASVRWTPPDSQDLQPGASATGFEIVGRGLPGISDVYAEGYHEAPIFLDGMATDSIPGYSDLTRYGPGVVGKTIVPVNLPSPFVAPSFLDTLAANAVQSGWLGWIKDQSMTNKYLANISLAKSSLLQNNIALARVTLQRILQDVDVDSSSILTSEAYALLRYNTEYLLAQLPSAPPPGLVVKLINSTGTRLTGGTLQYYDGTWKAATNNNDGTFSVNTTLTSVSLRMTYEGGSQQKSNVPVGPDTVVFQTVNTQVKLQNGQGTLIDTGAVQYYAGSWRSFGTTSDGVATKELLPVSYSFRMTYAYGSNDKQQDIGANPVVVFQTTNARVQLQNSLGAFIDQGSVQYYGGAWRNFGITTNGSVSKELLPNNYSFRMTYAYGSNDKPQNIGANPIVVFNTLNATVELRNSQGALVDGGSVQYYAGAWRTFGTTSGGLVSKELLPANYSFRMTSEDIPIDKSQNISTNSTVGFSTILCTVRVRNAQGQPVNGALASYYSGAWRQIGQTTNGEVTKELLPGNLTFRIVSGGTTQDKVQNLSTSALVEFIAQ